jgi:hypothetical protein
MATAIRSKWASRTAVLGAASVITVAALAATSTPAWASNTIKAKYKVTGSTYLAGPKFTLSLGPGKLSSTVNAKTGKLTATLSLPDATGTFKQSGVIPVTSTTQFINDGPTTGKLNLNTGAVTTTSKITLKIVTRRQLHRRRLPPLPASDAPDQRDDPRLR